MVRISVVFFILTLSQELEISNSLHRRTSLPYLV